MRTLIPFSPDLPCTKNNGQTLTINGLRKIINKDFMNASLEEARDLWVLSFFLMGLDIREILTAKKEDVMEGIFMAHINKDTKTPLPLYDIAMDVFLRFPGEIYALKSIERDGIPRRIEGHRRATRIRFDLNRRMEMVCKSLQVSCPLPMENTRLMWMLLAKEHGMDKKVVGTMADFTANIHNRKLKNSSLEKVAMENNRFMDLVFGIDDGPVTSGGQYPRKLEDGSVLLYES